MKPNVSELIPLKSRFTIEWFMENRNLSFTALEDKAGFELGGIEVDLGEYRVRYVYNELGAEDSFILRGYDWVLYDKVKGRIDHEAEYK